MPVSWLAYSSSQMTEATCSFESSVCFTKLLPHLLPVIQAMMNLDLLYGCSSLVLILWHSTPVCKAHCLRAFFNWIQRRSIAGGRTLTEPMFGLSFRVVHRYYSDGLERGWAIDCAMCMPRHCMIRTDTVTVWNIRGKTAFDVKPVLPDRNSHIAFIW